MRILHIFFYISLVIFFSILILIQLEISIPRWVRFYVNDFLCMPVVLTISIKAVHLIKKDDSIRLPLLLVLTLTSLYSVYFEYYLPMVEPRYTADWIDVVLYFSGAMVFYLLQFRR